MKRTKRYGGFRIGDRVKDRRGGFVGTVMNKQLGRLSVQFDGFDNKFTFMPNELINLTRIEEEHLVPKSEMNERLKKQEEERNKKQLDKFTRKHFNQSADEYLKEDIEMTKKIIEDLCKPIKDLPLFDWGAKDVLELEEEPTETPGDLFETNVQITNMEDDPKDDPNSVASLMFKPFKGHKKKKIVVGEKDFIASTISPYTRDVYTSTKDYD